MARQHEFDLIISAVNGGYSVRTAASGSEQPAQPFALPFDMAALPQRRRDAADWVARAQAARLQGTHAALDIAQHYIRVHRYVLRCDVEQFFPSIDHAVLRNQFAHHIADRQVLDLIDRILAGGVGLLDAEYRPVLFPGDDLLALLRPRGLPIGNLTSQFWANVVLHDLDMHVAHELRCRAYVRYCDDLMLFADDAATLLRWRTAIIEQLATLRLTAHESRAQVSATVAGVPFLGWTIAPFQRRLRKRNVIYFRQRWRKLVDAYSDGQLSLDRLTASARGWAAHTASGSTRTLRRQIFRQIVPRVAQ